MSIRAVGMVSGGLDSTLAACLMQRLGIEVLGVNFSTGFCLTDHQRVIASLSPEGSKRRSRRLRNEALRAGSDLSFTVEIIDISAEYMPVVMNPRYGYGSAMNPCIDCRIFMLSKAKAYMEQVGASFVFTGEVLGQRPMTQHRRTLDLIAKQSGLGGLLLRPLSARLLPPTIAETEGWVRRDDLLAIRGRGRKAQVELAERWGIEDYPQPAGGCCFLTDAHFTGRLKDLLAHRPQADLRPQDFVLLKIGRHMRISPTCKLVLGRDQGENTFIERFLSEIPQIRPVSLPGPTGIIQGEPTETDLASIAAIAAHYTAPASKEPVEFRVQGIGPDRIISALPADPASIERLRL
ncbi:MAG: hypothetical protein AB1714_25710 [Acidobacteriota bacterium]